MAYEGCSLLIIIRSAKRRFEYCQLLHSLLSIKAAGIMPFLQPDHTVVRTTACRKLQSASPQLAGSRA